MSFGAAAERAPDPRFPRPTGDAACPCGSGERFDGCCAPLLGGAPAPTAERLMRSRYTAFVVGDARYLGDTWHPGTRPGALDLDPRQRWTALEVLDVEDGGPDDVRGVVEFRARWRLGSGSGELHERSRFRRQGARWWYVDGIVR
jgi:SEC-C motif-containing protein